MIRINLLKERRIKKAMPLQAIIIPGAIITVITIIVLILYTFYLNSNISTLKAERTQKEKRISELKDAIKQVENFEKDNEEYRQKSMTIERLQGRQIMPLRLLDEVSARLPEGVWLDGLQDKGGSISISGNAFTNPHIVDYVQNLKKSEYLTDVTLLESRMKEVEGYTLYEFRLSFRMKE